MERTKSENRPLLFGVANSDHQCEAFDEQWPRDVRDDWELKHPRKEGTRFWQLYETDVDNAAWLGCQLFRLSISWARVQPSADQKISDDALRHYVEVVRSIRLRKMEPLVTLLHLVWPRWVQETGDNPLNGLLSDRFPDLFAQYAGEIAHALKDITYWCTINEPNTVIMGYLFPSTWRAGPPPGLSGEIDAPEALERLIPNLFRAHAKAFRVIKDIIPHALIGANPEATGLPPEHTQRLDTMARAITEKKSFAKHVKRLSRSRRTAKGPFRAIAPLLVYRATVTSALNGNWWHLGMAGALSTYLCPADCVGHLDYLGLDYYWGVDAWWRILRILKMISALSRGQYRNAPVWPQGLSQEITYLSGLFRGTPKPIMILENGCVDEADGYSRSRYIEEHVAEVLRAREQGADVIAYICWSISTNRELGAPFNPESDFGLFHIDLDGDPTLERHATAAATTYRNLIARHAAPSGPQGK
ncbi:MAG: family 1 glycosylhydrolase [Spirochaetia bacterium]